MIHPSLVGILPVSYRGQYVFSVRGAESRCLVRLTLWPNPSWWNCGCPCHVTMEDFHGPAPLGQETPQFLEPGCLIVGYGWEWHPNYSCAQWTLFLVFSFLFLDGCGECCASPAWVCWEWTGQMHLQAGFWLAPAFSCPGLHHEAKHTQGHQVEPRQVDSTNSAMPAGFSRVQLSCHFGLGHDPVQRNPGSVSERHDPWMCRNGGGTDTC